MTDFMIDSHVHLNRKEFNGEIPLLLERASSAGVSGFLNVGYDLQSSAESIQLAETHSGIRATVGIHPHDAAMLADAEGNLTAAGEQALIKLEAMAAHRKVVAIGEIGLDYYRDLSPRPAQATALKVQLDLAARVKLPVVFHIRDAWDETLELIEKHGVPEAGGVLHSFSGGADHVEWARRQGLMLGIGGPVTYKNSRLPELVALAGLDMLLLETDAPWLPPVPYRGKRNESSYLVHTCQAVASCLGLEPAQIAQATTQNFTTLFGGEIRE